MTTLAAPQVPAPLQAGAGARKTFTRDDLVRLASGDGPWTALPLLAQVLRGTPTDWGLRYLAAACFARVGLKSPAAEQFAKLPAELRCEPGIGALAPVIEALAEDRIGFEERRRVCKGNVGALFERGENAVDLRSAMARWEESRSASGEVWLRARDGNVVVQRTAVGGGSEEFRHLADFVGQVSALRLPHEIGREGQGAAVNVKPYVVEGTDPPWLLRRIMRGTPDQADGYRVRVSLVQRDELELLDGLSMVDLRAELSQPRLHIYAGEDATRRLERDLLVRPDAIMPGHFLGVAARSKEWGGSGRCVPTPEEVLQRAGIAQQAESIRLEAAVRVEYAGRDSAWYVKRFAANGEPLRVLIPTCRYSTYIQHAAADLAGAFGSIGCIARTLIEPDDQTQLSAGAYLRAMAEFRPDLVVLINYTRTNIGAVIPAAVPVVTWVQDSMPHLFDARTGGAMGALDFVVGHTHVELCEQFGFPAQNRMRLPVTACAKKFHDGPVDAALLEHFACDVGFITHHSDTPERLHERLCELARGSAGRRGGGVGAVGQAAAMVRVFEELMPRIKGLVEEGGEPLVGPRVRRAALEVTTDVAGCEPDAHALAMVVNQYAFPMADRMVRHRVMGWAADACERRGWRMRVFGRGWEKHERFGAMAGPEIAHGEELRAAYRAAGVTVHASIHWMYHQRVMECALSGGLPAVYLKADDVSLLRAYVVMKMSEVGCGMSDVRADGTRPFVAGERAAADCAEAMSFVAQLQRIGRPVHPAWAALTVDQAALDTARRAWGAMPDAPGAAFVLGDLAETTFATREGLERLIESAIESSRRRENLSQGIASRVREHYSTERAAERIVELVRCGVS